MAPASTFLSQNLLLAALPAEEADQLGGEMEHRDLTVRTVLYRQGDKVTHVYFPLSGIVSLVTVTLPGSTIELATVGREGVIGLPVTSRRDGISMSQAISQIGGEALRMPMDSFLECQRRLPRFAELIDEFVSALFALISQNAACNRLHTTEQRLSRWLLMCRDRMASDEFLLTQEFLGQMLGVRQASVSEAAAGLAEVEVIQYRRGRISLLDEARLEGAACECYARLRSVFDDLYH